jgi:hypothetical protein
MSESDQFRQYAEEAMVWVAQAKTEEEKQRLTPSRSRSLMHHNTLAGRPPQSRRQ